MAAEAATISVINKAMEISANLIIKTGSRIYHLQENINWIEREMRTLQSYLKDAESKRSMSHEVANLIINIRDLAQDVEDILDTYLPKIEFHNTEGPFHFIKQPSYVLSYVPKAHSFALEIEEIKRRAAEIEVSKEKCGVMADVNAGAHIDADLQDRRKLFLLAPRESNIVGREGILHKLKQEMLSDNKESRIISVVGPAGVGKTTVAKRVYQMTKNEFDVYAIVYVSQEPRLGEILLDIAQQVGLLKEEKKEKREEDKKEEKENMEDKLHSFLRKKRYAILLDDVWDTKTWDFLSNILPTNSENGSRIIVTSRYVDVGRYISGERSLIQLNLLDEEEGKTLFFDLISTTVEEVLPPVLRDISEKIVERCGGSPLAIVVAVGLLRARERSKNAWNQVLESMNQGVENNCMEILALSYQDLPTELKPLFLYFGMFPEDREIFIHELTKIWVLEKLIKVDGSRKPESIVEANIDKLISRNLIQVSKMRSDGRIRSVRIHDLLHNLCIQLAEDNNFFCTLNKLKTDYTTPVVRRVTCSSNDHADRNLRVSKKVRTLLYFSRDHEELFRLIKRNSSDLTFLRTLIIEIEGKIIDLPKEIAKLSGLSYLRLKGYLSSGIPSCIRNMKNLLTLEVISSTTWPAHIIIDIILRMKQLKHLLFWCNEIGLVLISSKILKGIEVALPNLESLDLDGVFGYYITPNSFKNCKMRKLRLWSVHTQTLETLSNATAPSLQNLEDLKLGPDFQEGKLSSPPRVDLSRYHYLVKLYLQQFPSSWQIQLPPNLVQITLERTPNIGDSMELLKGLSKLEIIKLKHCYGCKLNFSGEHNFPQLQILVLWEVDFDELIVDEKGLPKLYKLVYKPYNSSYQPVIPERLEKIMVVHEC